MRLKIKPGVVFCITGLPRVREKSGKNNNIKFQGSYRVLLKSTCAFCAFFSHSWLFFPVIFWKMLFCAFFLAKMCFFFLLNLLFFHKNTTNLEVLDTKRQIFFSKFVILCSFLWKKIQPCFTRHKVHSLYLYIPLDQIKIYRNNA